MRISDWSSDVCSSDLLLRPDTGRVELGDTVLTDTDAGTFVPTHARGVAMLSQQAMLFPRMNVAANGGYAPRDRKRDVEGQSVSVRVDLGGCRIITKKKRESIKSQEIKKKHKNR